MKNLYLFLLLFLSGTSLMAQKYSKVKIYTDHQGLAMLAQQGLPVDHGDYKENTFFISDFSEQEISVIQSSGLPYEILVDDVVAKFLEDNVHSSEGEFKNATCATVGGGSSGFTPATPSNFNLGTMGGYLKYNEMLAELDAMAAQYPNLITVKAPISTYLTHENRPIYYVKISDNPSNDEAGEEKVLYTAIHHAREPMSLMETIFYMWYLLENYSTSEEIQFLVNNTQLYFVPCINPDGYIYNQTTNPNGGGMWRKNRRNNGGGVYGVDLNRNYSYGWGTTGTSTNPSNDTYCGPSAFSEPETQAMRWLVQNNNFVTAFNAHTYAEDILFPIGTTTAEFADHHDYFQDEANHMVQYNGYTAMKSSGLYPASGDSDDYMYKVDIGVGQKDTIFVHTPEVGTAFWQPSGEIVATCRDMVFPNLVLAHLPHKYMVVEDTDPSTVQTMTGNFNHSVQRLGLEDGNVTVSIQPIQNIQSVGAGVVYNIPVRATGTGTISYTLDPGIQFGDEIIYVLQTEYGLWTKRDTIYKTFGAITEQIVENGSAANWTGNWNTTTSTFVSPSTSYTDSPSGNYVNNANRTYTYVPSIDLTNATAAMITYYAKWDIETNYDFVQFQVSTDGGTSWIGQCGLYTVPGTSANGSVQPNNQPVYEGTQTSWVQEEISLSDYLGQVIKVRFQLRSDNGQTEDGFYFDDFKILYNLPEPPAPPVANFEANVSSVCVGESVTFTDLSTNDPTSWNWNFGDGTSSGVQSPVHTYDQEGTYDVTLTVTNANGSDDQVLTGLITVHPLPVLNIISSEADNTICVETTATINLSSEPSGAVFTGEFVTAGVFDPTAPGDYTINATYTDINGCSVTEQIILVAEACNAGINGNEVANILVYPNPTEGNVTVSGITTGSLIRVNDPQGKLILELVANAETESIALPDLSSGVYFLTVENPGIHFRTKLTILN